MKSDRPKIDWEVVRRRLAANAAALDAALTTSPERVEAVYRERAVALANRQAQVAPVGRRVLVFALGAERYGLDFGDVAGVLPFDACTPVPGGPPELLGVMNIAGEIRSVLDLGRVLGLPPVSVAGGYVLRVGSGNRTAYCRVDAFDRVRLVHPSEVASPYDDAKFPLVSGVTLDHVKLLKTVGLLDHMTLSE